ncbi:MAG: hypothetical protein K0S26_973 [Bacteroidota bacterium]|jgi:hypothetical protein|nr:hypothetical protein [Bacteroidota bacterium]
MNFPLKSTLLLLYFFCAISLKSNAQDDENELSDTNRVHYVYSEKGFHAGLYIGAFWANRSTAYIYDGYGFDENGQRNTFSNSILYNQIVNVYGGANGGIDYIAQLLNVNHGDWYFNEQGMPINLRYTTTFAVGLNARYQIHKKAGILLNINASKLVVNGKFTISSTTPNNGFQSQAKINEFIITGAEQRLMFQLGYQRILGNNEKLNFMVEGGLNIILSKAQKNQAILNSDLNGGSNNFTIDLMTVYNQPPYSFYSVKYLIGAGIGAVGGIGFHLTFNPRYTIQLLYNPSYDRIGLGYNPSFKLQHGVGLRIYYNLS